MRLGDRGNQINRKRATGRNSQTLGRTGHKFAYLAKRNGERGEPGHCLRFQADDPGRALLYLHQPDQTKPHRKSFARIRSVRAVRFRIVRAGRRDGVCFRGRGDPSEKSRIPRRGSLAQIVLERSLQRFGHCLRRHYDRPYSR